MTIDYLWLIVKIVGLNITYFRNLLNLFCKSSWRLHNKSRAKYYEFFKFSLCPSDEFPFSFDVQELNILLHRRSLRSYYGICLSNIYPGQKGISDVLIHSYVLNLRCFVSYITKSKSPCSRWKTFYSKKQHALILVFPRRFKVLFTVLLIS